MLEVMKKNMCAGYMAALVCSTGLTAAYAQETDGAAQDPRVLESIVVTADKRAESIQSVGSSITALGVEDIDRLNIRDGRDVFDRFPNLSLTSNASEAQAQVSVRGISFQNFSPVTVSPVGMFMDDINLNSQQVFGLFLYDMERIEIVRGPQNTLYGRNTTAGAINFITRAPEIGAGFTGHLGTTYGRFNQFDIDGAIGFDLGETAAMRVSVNSQQRDGIFKNLTTGTNDTDRNKTGFRAQLLWEPSDGTSILARFHTESLRSDGRRTKSIGLLDPNDYVGRYSDVINGGVGNCPVEVKLGSGCVDSSGFADTASRRENFSGLPNTVDDVDTTGASITANFDLGGMTLTSISAFESNTYVHSEDSDGGPEFLFNFFINSEQEQYSQELRLVSDVDAPLRWIVGGMYFFEDTNSQIYSIFPGDVTDIANTYSIASFSDVDQDDEMATVYGEVEYDIADDLTVIVGGRYIWEEKKGVARVLFGFPNTVDTPGAYDNSDGVTFDEALAGGLNLVVPGEAFKDSFSDYAMKLQLDYQAADDVLLYGKVSRGVKAFQFSTAPVVIRRGFLSPPVDSEKVWSYEAGVKSELFDRTLRVNLSGFYNRYNNQQIQVFESLGGAFFAGLVDIDETETYGAELETVWVPAAIDGLTIDLGIGYLETKVLDDDDRPALIGNKLVNAPKFSINGGIVQEFDVSAPGLGESVLSLQADGRYTSSRYFHPSNAPLLKDDSYFVLNASANLTFGDDGQFTFSIWGKNITSALYFQNMVDLGYGDIQAFVNDPATYGATLKARF